MTCLVPVVGERPDGARRLTAAVQRPCRGALRAHALHVPVGVTPVALTVVVTVDVPVPCTTELGDAEADSVGVAWVTVTSTAPVEALWVASPE